MHDTELQPRSRATTLRQNFGILNLSQLRSYNINRSCGIYLNLVKHKAIISSRVSLCQLPRSRLTSPLFLYRPDSRMEKIISSFPAAGQNLITHLHLLATAWRQSRSRKKNKKSTTLTTSKVSYTSKLSSKDASLVLLQMCPSRPQNRTSLYSTLPLFLLPASNFADPK